MNVFTKVNKVFLIFLIILLVFNFSCKKGSSVTHSGKLIIMTTINPYYLLTKEIVGDKFLVELFIPPNASPHTFSPNPGDIIKLEKASLIIADGLGLERQFENKLSTLKDKLFLASDSLPDKNIFLFSENIPKTKAGDADIDPHIWLDSQNLILIAKGITARLNILKPEFADTFNTNLDVIVKKIQDTDNIILSERKGFDKEINLIMYHDAFQYFCRRYNINIVGSFEAFPGQVLSPKELLDIGKIAKQYNVKAIYSESQLNPKSVNILADEYNLPIGFLDPLGFSFKAKSICDILQKNWEEIKKYQ